MLKTAMEAAALIGVVVAVIAGGTYALGTVAHLSYFEALGFDGHQFPAISSELQVFGWLLGAMPALFLGVVVLAYICLSVLINRSTSWLDRHPLPKKLRIPLGLAMFAVAIVMGFVFGPHSLGQWVFAAILVGTTIMAAVLLGEWVPTVVMSCVILALLFPLAILVVNGEAYRLGQARAAKAGKKPGDHNHPRGREQDHRTRRSDCLLRTLLRLS